MTMNSPSWGYALFGKKDGFEVFQTAGLLHSLYQGGDREEVSNFLQLKLEEIRIFEDTCIYRLSQHTIHGQTLLLYSLFTYALDDYQRDGYRAVSLALQGLSLEAEDIRKFLDLMLHEGGQEDSFIRRLGDQMRPFSPESLVGHPSFIPLQTSSPAEANVLIEAWTRGQLEESPILYFSHSERVGASIQGRNIQCMDHNPFWQKASKAKPEKVLSTGNSSLFPRSKIEDAPSDSLIFAYEEEGGDRWAKATSALQSKPKSNIWGWVLAIFACILVALFLIK